MTRNCLTVKAMPSQLDSIATSHQQWRVAPDSLKLKKAKAKACLTAKSDQPRFTIIRSGSWSTWTNGAAVLMQPSTARTNKQLDPQQLANTPLPQSTTPGLHPISIHQMAPPQRTSNCSLLLIYWPRKD